MEQYSICRRHKEAVWLPIASIESGNYRGQQEIRLFGNYRVEWAPKLQYVIADIRQDGDMRRTASRNEELAPPRPANALALLAFPLFRGHAGPC